MAKDQGRVRFRGMVVLGLVLASACGGRKNNTASTEQAGAAGLGGSSDAETEVPGVGGSDAAAGISGQGGTSSVPLPGVGGAFAGPHCGDQIVQVELGEQCDDGVNDGGYQECATDCQPGAFCGDGVLDVPYEECDDANQTRGDGCSASCRQESPWCPPDGCNPVIVVCGDAKLGPGEVCDDGNAVGGDGCTATCAAIEPGYACHIPGQACQPIDSGLAT